MATQQRVIQAFMAALDTTTLKGTAAVDAAIKACSNFSSTQAVINKMLADYKKAGNGDTFLKKYCGIDLTNTDTGAITGKDAGGSKVKTGTNVVPNKTFNTKFEGTSFTKRGVTFQLAYQDNEGYRYPLNDFNALTKEAKHVWQGLYSFWAEESLKLIEESYGYSFKDSDAKFNQVRVFFVDDSSKSRYTAKSFDKIYEKSTGKYVYLGINMYYFKHIDQNNLDGKYPYWDDYYLDRLIAHELTHVIMNAKVNNFPSLPAIITEGLAELTCGMDDSQDINIKKAVASKSMLEKLLVLQEDYNEVDGINNEDYVAGYILLRYLAKQSAVSKLILGTNANDSFNNSLSGATIQALGGNDRIYNTGKKTKIYTGAGIDSIFNHAANVTIDGGDGADYIYNASVASNSSIIAGAGNDSIFNHGQKVTISGGNDADYISNFNGNVKIYGGAGNDSIYANKGVGVTIDAGSGNDYVSNSSSNASILGGTGNDSIYSIEGKNVTINAGSGKDFILNFSSNASILGGADSDSIYNDSLASSSTLDGGTGNDSIDNRSSKVLILGGKGNDTIRNYGTNVTIDGGSNNDKIYNYASSKVTIIGGDGADTITNWGGAASMSGGNGNDVIWGDAGKDTILGGDGDDKLHGEAGNDKIYGGNGNDSLWGGKGNDSLWGGSGADTFIYTTNEGTDRIKDYSFSEGDMLKILKSDGKEDGTFTGCSFKKNALTLAISGGGSVIFESVSKGNKFKINGTTYTFNGSKLK